MTELEATANQTEAEVIASVAMMATDPTRITDDERDLLVYGSPDKVAVVDLNDYRATPRYKTGSPTFRDVISIANYIYDQAETPRLYADPDHQVVRAVFDDHDGDQAGRREFQALLRPVLSTAWKKWNQHSGTYYDALDLAEILTDLRATIMDPPTADIVEMIGSFRATRNVTFQNEIVDKTGDVKIAYAIDTKAGGRGELEIPDMIKLAVPVFDGTPNVEVVARFRYRLRTNTDGAHASFGVMIENADDILADAFSAILNELNEETDLPVLIGTPSPF